MAVSINETLYFDRVVRTEKAHTLLALAYAYHYKDTKDETMVAFKYFLDIFRNPPEKSKVGSGSYGNFLVENKSLTDEELAKLKKSFSSQYTPAREFGVLTEDGLSKRGEELVQGKINIYEYMSSVFLNYFQVINNRIVHVLNEILNFMCQNNKTIISKKEFYEIEAFNNPERDNVNMLFNLLSETLFFKIDQQEKECLELLFPLDKLIGELHFPETKELNDFIKHYSNQTNYSNFLTQDTFILTDKKYLLTNKNEKMPLDLYESFKIWLSKKKNCEVESRAVIDVVGALKNGVPRVFMELEGEKIDVFLINSSNELSNIRIKFFENEKFFRNNEPNMDIINALDLYIEFFKLLDFGKKEKAINISLPHNRILYGAPGTGKSYKLEEQVEAYFPKIENQIEIQEEYDAEDISYWLVGASHDSKDMTDIFISQGYWENGYNNRYQDQVNQISPGDCIAIKSSFTRKMNGKHISVLRVKAIGIVKENFKNGKRVLVDWKVKETKDYDNISYRATIHKIKGNNEFLFAPILHRDKAKVEIVMIPTHERVTFYDGYTYGQFIGTYKPIKEGTEITYDYIPGSFTRLLLEAYKNPKSNFCLIIEELNRAKADKVFGNIFQLLDRKEDGTSQYKIALSEDQKNYFNTELAEFEILQNLLNEGLYLPNNFYIWATMNSADQGVYPLDSAFKRRWSFEHIGLNENEDKFGDKGQKYYIQYSIGKEEIEWNDFRRQINNELLKHNIPEDRLLAPFFIKSRDFIKENGKNILDEKVFLNKILVYLFDDVLRHKKKTILFSEECSSFSNLKDNFINKKSIFSLNFEKITTILENDTEEENV